MLNIETLKYTLKWEMFCNHGAIMMGSICWLLYLLMSHYNEDANFLFFISIFFFLVFSTNLANFFFLGARHKWKPLLNCILPSVIPSVVTLQFDFFIFFSSYCIFSNTLNVIILRRMNSKNGCEITGDGVVFRSDAASDQILFVHFENFRSLTPMLMKCIYSF